MKLLDGPVAGSYSVQNCPLYLRAVLGPRGKTDVLDAPGDTPEPNETIYVYVRVSEPSYAQLCFRGKNKKASGRYASADYRWVADLSPETNERFRDSDEWQDWSSRMQSAINTVIGQLAELA